MSKNYKKYLINREVSWLQFNERVLQEARDETTPLLERLKFLGIFSNNRDEFFRVRVATLTRIKNAENLDFPISFSPAELLSEIVEIVEQQEQLFTQTYNEILKQLAGKNIFILREDELSEKQSACVTGYFQDQVRPLLFPMMLDNLNDPAILEDRTIYLAVHMFSSENPDKENYSIVKVPSSILSRFLIIPSEEEDKICIILLDDVVRLGLPHVFSLLGFDNFQAYTIKVTRDAEMDLDNDVQKSFLEIMSESIKQREWGTPVRFVFDKAMPEKFLKKIRQQLKISDDDRQRGGGRYHNFRDFMDFPKVGPPDLVYPQTPPMLHKDLKPNKSIFEVLRKKDIMLNFPYQSFNYVVDLLREASIDPDVRSIKMTFYRVAKRSNVMNALMNAARNGKVVTVFLELQARFDEEANIYWAETLQKTGVKVIPTIPGIKVHSKLILIRRQEAGENIYYANISTGNFNESTAKVYADYSLLTANQDIGLDVHKLFQMFETRYNIPKFKEIIVSPFETRDFFLNRINTEIRNAKAGKESWAVIKLNSLVDKKIVRKLYEASQAGVKITIIARGICVLMSGIPKLSENIETFSIVDKFLEHARLFIFCNDGNNQYFIGSSDWMQRNFDHRIEVTTPVYDPEIRNELWDMIQIQLKDNCKARLLDHNKVNQYKQTDSKTKVRSQFETYNYFKNKLNQSS
jgi:polyphosphate kinase